MKRYPSIPRIANAPSELLEGGHLWLLEKIDGANFRFQLQHSGLIQFGDRTSVFDDPDTIPEPYQHTVRHIRENLNREVLRDAVDDVEDVVFFGETTSHHTIEYAWQSMPSFLGFDVWSVDAGTFRSPDAVEQIFEQLGLHSVNVFERERRAQDFDLDSYTVPQSAWYEGPAEGVIIRNKRGLRAKVIHPDFVEVDDVISVAASAEELAEKYATRRRFKRLIANLDEQNRSVTFEALYERVLESIAREAHEQLYRDDGTINEGLFRSEVAALTREFLDGRAV